MSVLYVFVKKKTPSTITIPILTLLNSKYIDRRIAIYFFKKYLGINIGKYTYDISQILNSEYRTLESIGSFCSIANGLTLAGYNHPISLFTTHPMATAENYGFMGANFTLEDYHPKNKKIIIENDVWIGANVTILPSVRICNGAIIGAGTLVHKSVPPYAIVGGVPAQLIKYRFSETTIDMLQKLKWWSWEDIKIREFCKGLYYDDIRYDDRESYLQKHLEGYTNVQ